jgi:hypothetical protein
MFLTVPEVKSVELINISNGRRIYKRPDVKDITKYGASAPYGLFGASAVFIADFSITTNSPRCIPSPIFTLPTI